MPFPFKISGTLEKESMQKEEAKNLILQEGQNEEGMEISFDKDKILLIFLAAMPDYSSFYSYFTKVKFWEGACSFRAKIELKEKGNNLSISYSVDLWKEEIIWILAFVFFYWAFGATSEEPILTGVIFFSFWLAQSFIGYEWRKDTLIKFIHCSLDKSFKEKEIEREKSFNFLLYSIVGLVALFSLFLIIYLVSILIK